jgi:Anti-sigma-K factor rskA
MTHNERVEELLALEALDALDDEDGKALSRALAEHIPDCSECARLRREFGDAAGRLAFALHPVAVREEIVEDILRAERGIPIRRARKWRTAFVVAAAVVLVAVGAGGGYLLALSGKPDVSAVARFLARADVRLVRFEGAQGDLAAAVAPDEGFLFGSDIPALPEGRVYELWVIRDGAAVKGGCVEPRDGIVAAWFEADVSRGDALAVTIEPTSCLARPSTEPVYVAQLQP